MKLQSFTLSSHNGHYEGAYSETEMEWRRLCSIDKAHDLKALLAATPVQTVLEVGCGTGAVLAEVARSLSPVARLGTRRCCGGVSSDAGLMDLVYC